MTHPPGAQLSVLRLPLGARDLAGFQEYLQHLGQSPAPRERLGSICPGLRWPRWFLSPESQTGTATSPSWISGIHPKFPIAQNSTTTHSSQNSGGLLDTLFLDSKSS